MKNLKDYIIQEGFLRKNLGLGKDVLIQKWLDEHKITDYMINQDLTIDVDCSRKFAGCLDFQRSDIEEFPDYIQFGKIMGNMHCGRMEKLKSLRGFPKEITGYFHIGLCNNLKNLVGGPKFVGDDFKCGGCKNLESLEGAPEEVIGDFNCVNCPKLKSLKGAPKTVGGNFYCGRRRKPLFTVDDVKNNSNVSGHIDVSDYYI